MEDLLSVSSFLLILLLSLPSLSSAAADAYTLPTSYFINCGSADGPSYTSRTFVGDLSKAFSSSSSAFSQDSSPVSSNSSSGLYGTARIFRGPNSSYSFNIRNPGSPHFLRLHFSAFVSADGLSDALFDVSIAGLTLLRNFSVPGPASKNNSSVATVEEFLLTIQKERFAVYFTPIGKSSFAFVNALEVFPVPEWLLPGPAPTTMVSLQGQNGSNTASRKEVLTTRYRVNVGGSEVQPDADTLWRQWSTDSSFIQDPAASQPANASTINYRDDLPDIVDNYTAPEYVYQTARHLNTRNGVYSNVTWRFNAGTNSSYVVRFHFCDIVAIADNTVYIKLYVFDHYSIGIQPYNDSIKLTNPFKKDLVVESGTDGFIKVGIGNYSGSDDAYLNGIEIMEVIGSWDWNSIPPKPGKGHIGLILWIALGSFGALLIMLLLVGVIAMRCRRRKEPSDTVSVWSALPALVGLGSSHGNKSSDPSISSSSPVPNLHLGLKISLSEILSATNNFDSKMKIGRGGFGNVYRGTLKDGTRVAVKRSEPGSSQGLLEFHTEIIVLSMIRHRHLVSLIGYCAERMEMILVYEFMEKGTLRDHLYNSNNADLPPSLPWKQRLEISIGAARGLHYLHTGAAGGIIHRDVKSTNILLDDTYVAKVADFGLSKLGSSLVDQSQVSTGFKGTFGYLDPEYLKTQQLTEKSDVYAFGVVLLEVLCARPPIDPVLQREQMNLAEWGIANFHKGTLEDIIDPQLSGQINPNSLRKFGETAEKCLKEDDQERPSMGDVLWDLEYALQLQQSPAPRQLHEDSMTNGSSMLGLSEVRRLPSFSMSFVGDDSMVVKEEEDPDASTG